MNIEVKFIKDLSRRLAYYQAKEETQREREEALINLTEFLETVKFDSGLGYDPMLGEINISSLGFPALPKHLPHAKALQPDVIIVPLVGFMTTGHRLGRGGGFYDKVLAESKALSIGVATEHRNIIFIPEDHDIKLDVIVTNKRIIDNRGG